MPGRKPNSASPLPFFRSACLKGGNLVVPFVLIDDVQSARSTSSYACPVVAQLTPKKVQIGKYKKTERVHCSRIAAVWPQNILTWIEREGIPYRAIPLSSATAGTAPRPVGLDFSTRVDGETTRLVVVALWVDNGWLFLPSFLRGVVTRWAFSRRAHGRTGGRWRATGLRPRSTAPRLCIACR